VIVDVPPLNEGQEWVVIAVKVAENLVDVARVNVVMRFDVIWQVGCQFLPTKIPVSPTPPVSQKLLGFFFVSIGHFEWIQPSFLKGVDLLFDPFNVKLGKQGRGSGLKLLIADDQLAIQDVDAHLR